MSSKTCVACGAVKAFSDFYRQPNAKSGLMSKCKECVKAAVRLNRMAKIDYYRAFDRSRSSLPNRVSARSAYEKTEAFRISHALANKKYQVANALRRRAAIKVGNAIRDGRLDPQPCFVCGKDKVQAHHPDYAAPFAVAWLCATHHAQLHKEHREFLRQTA